MILRLRPTQTLRDTTIEKLKTLYSGFGHLFSHTNSVSYLPSFYKHLKTNTATQMSLFAIIHTGHQDSLGSLPVLSFQTTFAVPVAPIILHTFNLGTFGIIAFEDGGTAGIF